VIGLAVVEVRRVEGQRCTQCRPGSRQAGVAIVIVMVKGEVCLGVTVCKGCLRRFKERMAKLGLEVAEREAKGDRSVELLEELGETVWEGALREDRVH
jgi:hypothetical protein